MSHHAPEKAGDSQCVIVPDRGSQTKNATPLDSGSLGGGSLHAEGTIPKWEDPVFPNARKVEFNVAFKCKMESKGKFTGEVFTIPWEFPTLVIPPEQLFRQMGPHVTAMKYLSAH